MTLWLSLRVQVIRIEMQSLKADPGRPQAMTMMGTARHIYQSSGLLGFFRGIVPRIGIAVWASTCMIGFGDMVKDKVPSRTDKIRL